MRIRAGECTCSVFLLSRGGYFRLVCMYEDFVVTDRWTGEQLHCQWRATIVAIATRHADATDIRFAVNGRAVWIALPNVAWVEQRRRNGKVITDYLAAQIAGRYLKQAVESGYDNGREIYTMTVEEVLEQAEAIVKEAGGTVRLPTLPVINDDEQPERALGIALPGEPLEPGIESRAEMDSRT